MKNRTSESIDQIIFTPNEAGTLTLKMLDQLRQDAGGGVRFGVPDIDKHLVPLRSGQLVVVQGRPGHYKSGLMNWLAKQAIKTIAPDDTTKIVVKVTWEQSVEEDTLSWMASDANISITQMARGMVDGPEFEILKKKSMKRSETPLWVVGHSQQESKEQRRSRPRMTMTDVALALDMITGGEITGSKYEIEMIVMDYLQRIRPDPQDGNTRREQMMEIVNRAKDAAISFGCPVVLGVQSGRDVDKKEDKLPGQDDGQETSNIEQACDVMFSVSYPIKYPDHDAAISGIPVTKNLLMVGLMKQKLGEWPFRFGLYFEPEKNIIKGLYQK